MENGFAFRLSVRIWYALYTSIAFISVKSSLWQTKIARFGEIAQWIRFVERQFGLKPKLYVNKDKLRLEAIESFKKNEDKVMVIELGVAYGKGSKWLVSNLKFNLHSFYGFDRFTGLPRKWRGLDAGHFSTDGEHPIIDDIRVHWYVGDAEETIKLFELEVLSKIQKQRDFKLFVLFDMDILEPTMECYEILKKYLVKGDYVHFDEGFDLQNEGQVIEKFVKEFSQELIGVTSEAILMKLVD